MAQHFGIIKLYLPILFGNDMIKTTSYNVETINFMKSLPANSYIDILSSTDLTHNIYTSEKQVISNKNIDFVQDYSQYDAIFIFNSKNITNPDESRDTQRLFMAEVNKYYSQLSALKVKKPEVKQFYIITDIPLIDIRFANLANALLTQSADNSLGTYAMIEKNSVLGMPIKSLEKTIKLLYVGNERDRLDKMEEYFKIPGFEVYGNFSKTSPIRSLVKNEVGLIDWNIAQEKLQHSKYSIVFSDKDYRKFNFLTPRYYECLLANNITFIDASYDKGNYLLKSGDFRIVNNAQELEEKIRLCDNDSVLSQRLLNEQHREINYLKNNYKKMFRNIIKQEMKK